MSHFFSLYNRRHCAASYGSKSDSESGSAVENAKAGRRAGAARQSSLATSAAAAAAGAG